MAVHLSLRWLATAYLLTYRMPSAHALSVAQTPAEAINALSRRDLTCANASLNTCQSVDARLPGDFCCKSGQNCISADSASTIICCPANGDCSAIVPISCNITNQDASSFPGASVQTTRLNDKLPTCGGKCCPFGYTCDGTGDSAACIIDKDTSSLSPNFQSTPQSTTTATTSATSSASTSSPTASGIDSTKPLPSGQCPRFTGVAIVAGFFPGFLLGLLTMLLVILFFGSRKPSSRPISKSSSLYKPGTGNGRAMNISNPIPLQAHSPRTEFLRRTTTRAKSLFSSRDDASAMESSYNWKMPTPPAENNIPREPPGRLVPVTPQRQVKGVTKAPSTESIRIYSPSQELPRLEPAVMPVRNMQPQRSAHEKATIGSPFKTPPTTQKYTYPDKPEVVDRAETLTPARYDDGRRRKERNDESRPTTTFTEMLSGINFPDPGRPPIPQVPKSSNWGGKGGMI